MVTTTVRVINGRHGNTPNARPAIALSLESEVVVTGLQHRLLNTSTSSDQTNHGTAITGDGLLLSRRKLHTRLASIRVVSHDDGVGATGLGKGGTITDLGLQVAHDGTFRQTTNRQHIADGQLSWKQKRNDTATERDETNYME